jgi:hypothetical protein
MLLALAALITFSGFNGRRLTLTNQLRGNATAAGAFTGAHPELVSNSNWPGSATK